MKTLVAGGIQENHTTHTSSATSAITRGTRLPFGCNSCRVMCGPALI